MALRSYRHHFAKTVAVRAKPDALFAYVDDHERLASHMMRSSMMMAGNRMEISFDDKQGRAIGAVIGMSGRMLGINLELKEVVTERIDSESKVWETIGTPRLYVIGHYRMGFSMARQDDGSAFTVFIDYNHPEGAWAWLGWLLGGFYSRWCVVSMADGVAAHFDAADLKARS
ncbi:MAG: hypothetical protein J7485_09375 [Sphingobium sp.]|nr:hypothetical protein [Sphingobium sp.]